MPDTPHRSDLKAERVARTIMGWIADGELMPGERLPGERTLADSMDVSRVSVRAALQKLKAQGLLTAVQGGGTRVASATATLDEGLTTLTRARFENLRDLAEIRMALETWAARRAAERAGPEEIAEIKRCLEAMTGDPATRDEDKAEADARFHLAIGKAADSAVYIHFLATIRDVLSQMLTFHRHELFGDAADDATVLSHHRAIYHAIARNDPDAAASCMRAHLAWVLSHYNRTQAPRGASSL
jgi:DNA-binding FadR family transcriptional regulator